MYIINTKLLVYKSILDNIIIAAVVGTDTFLFVFLIDSLFSLVLEEELFKLSPERHKTTCSSCGNALWTWHCLWNLRTIDVLLFIDVVIIIVFLLITGNYPVRFLYYLIWPGICINGHEFLQVDIPSTLRTTCSSSCARGIGTCSTGCYNCTADMRGIHSNPLIFVADELIYYVIAGIFRGLPSTHSEHTTSFQPLPTQ